MNNSLRVPAMYLTPANVRILAFFAFSGISKLRLMRPGQNSDSPRLHHLRSPFLASLAKDNESGECVSGCGISCAKLAGERYRQSRAISAA